MNMSKLENVVIESVIPDNDYICLNGNQYRMNPNLKKLFKGSDNRPSLLQAGDTVDAVLNDDIIKSLHKKIEGSRGSIGMDTPGKEPLKRVGGELECDMRDCLGLAIQLVGSDPKTLEKDDDSFTVMRIVKIAQFFDACLCGTDMERLQIIANQL